MIHLLVGLYLAEICMIGLFMLKLAVGAMVLMLLFLIVTGLVHLSLNEALHPLLYNLPLTLSVETDDQLEHHTDVEGDAVPREHTFTGPPPGWDDDLPPLEDDNDGIHQGITSTRGIPVEGADGLLEAVSDWSKAKFIARLKSQATNLNSSSLGLWLRNNVPFPVLYNQSPAGGPQQPNKSPNFLLKWLHPEIYEDFSVLRAMMPTEIEEPGYNDDLARRAYFPPAVATPAPQLWIPRDDACVSRQEVAHTGKVIRIYDDGAYLDEKGRTVVDMDASPVAIPKVLY
jgi:calcium permeable stress-gated cation channel